MRLKQVILVLGLSLMVFACNDVNEKPAQEVENQVGNNTSDDGANVSEQNTKAADTNVATEQSSTQAEATKAVETEEKAATTKFTGYVVSLSAFITGKNDRVSGETASKLLTKGQILGLYSNGQVYLVYNTDGTYASKKLAQIAGKDITITGNMKEVDGSSVIIAEKFD